MWNPTGLSASKTTSVVNINPTNIELHLQSSPTRRKIKQWFCCRTQAPLNRWRPAKQRQILSTHSGWILNSASNNCDLHLQFLRPLVCPSSVPLFRTPNPSNASFYKHSTCLNPFTFFRTSSNPPMFRYLIFHLTHPAHENNLWWSCLGYSVNTAENPNETSAGRWIRSFVGTGPHRRSASGASSNRMARFGPRKPSLQEFNHKLRPSSLEFGAHRFNLSCIRCFYRLRSSMNHGDGRDRRRDAPYELFPRVGSYVPHTNEFRSR